MTTKNNDQLKVGLIGNQQDIIEDIAIDLGYIGKEIKQNFLNEFEEHEGESHDVEEFDGDLIEEIEIWLKDEGLLPLFTYLYVEGEYVAVHVDFEQVETALKDGSIEKYKGDNSEEIGFVLDINDHGNATLYNQNAYGEYEVIWAVV